MKIVASFKQRWDVHELFGKIEPSAIALSAQRKAQIRQFLWMDLCAEYDAINLYREIHRNPSQYSDPFLSFIERWNADEANHARGFAMIYGLCYACRGTYLPPLLAARPVSFLHLREYLVDEFKLCLLLAYDELATTLTYRKDVDFYNEFGAEEFNTWIRKLQTDEAAHYASLIRLIMQGHRHRLHEVPALMQQILEMDLQKESYTGTFVLDHSPDCVHFSLDERELSLRCAQTLVRKLTRPEVAFPYTETP